MLKISHLSKKYKKNSNHAIKDLSLEVARGEIVGFLGQNGAGKSTTLKCIIGAIPFDSGTITVNEYDVIKEPIKTKELIGFVSDQPTAYENLTGKEYVNFIGNVYFVPLNALQTRFEKCVKEFNMQHLINKPISTYSLGYKQLISIIAIIVRQPLLWIMDEPTVSLDVDFSDKVEKMMLNAKEEGSTIFFSSHYIELLERICDKVVIIKNGILLEVINLKQFKKKNPNSLKEYYLKLINQ